MSPRRQSAVGLALAGAIAGGWIAVHLGGIFLVDIGAETLLLILIAVLLQSWLSTGLFIVAHDAMHGSLAPAAPRLQRLAGRAALMIYAGIDYDRMAPAHFAHHKHVGTGRDPDFHADDPVRFWPWLRTFFLRYYTHGQILRITLAATVYMLLGASLLNIALFWAVPALLALVQLFYFGTYLPHRHGSRAFADRHRARSMEMPRWLSLVTCFHFGAYHHEHHLYPGAPWWQLPARRASAAKRAATSPSLRPNSPSV